MVFVGTEVMPMLSISYNVLLRSQLTLDVSSYSMVQGAQPPPVNYMWEFT